ncbi:MAG: D-amino acid aminotransferase [Hahellaceae bacterium]|nr:D-amino acid aminotransferase [Hahellaceae bacterium]MCP5210849.1 D-amino acid aminotransferase [Hahellaceae bacterium]
MSIAYLNGQYLPLSDAKVSPMDRGFLFADGVYEVVPVYQGKPFGLEKHLERLERSLSAIKLASGLSQTAWIEAITEIIRRNGGGHQLVYLQVTRGVAEVRDHRFPDIVVPTIFIMSSAVDAPKKEGPLSAVGISAVTIPDIRWGRCDIKSVALLPNILGRQQAIEKHADEAIFIREDLVTECPAANVFIVKQNEVVTPPLNETILGGVTRDIVISLLEKNHILCRQRPVMKMELFTADEIWISSSSKDLLPVTMLDGNPVGEGVPGALWRRAAEMYQQYKHNLFGIA